MPRSKIDRDYYTVAQAAEYLDVSPSTIWRWIKSERLPAYRAGPKNIRIKKLDLDRVLTPAREPAQVAARREEVNAVREIMPISTSPTLRPLTEEQVRQARAALAEADQGIEAIRARRKGIPLSDSADIIREARAERSEQLL